MIHGKIDIMLEQLWFAEENEGRVVGVDEIYEVDNISMKAFDVPSEASERKCGKSGMVCDQVCQVRNTAG